MRKKQEIIFDFIPMSSCTAAWNFFTFMILDFSSFVSIENHKRTNIQEPIEWFVLMVSSIACRFHKFLHVWQLCWLVNKARIVKSSVFDSNWGNMKHLRGPGGMGTNIDYVMQLYTIAQRNSQFFYIYHTNLKSCLGVTLVCIDFGPVTIVSMPAPCRVANNTYWFRGTWLCPSELIVKVTY